MTSVRQLLQMFPQHCDLDSWTCGCSETWGESCCVCCAVAQVQRRRRLLRLPWRLPALQRHGCDCGVLEVLPTCRPAADVWQQGMVLHALSMLHILRAHGILLFANVITGTHLHVCFHTVLRLGVRWLTRPCPIAHADFCVCLPCKACVAKRGGGVSRHCGGVLAALQLLGAHKSECCMAPVAAPQQSTSQSAALQLHLCPSGPLCPAGPPAWLLSGVCWLFDCRIVASCAVHTMLCAGASRRPPS